MSANVNKSLYVLRSLHADIVGMLSYGHEDARRSWEALEPDVLAAEALAEREAAEEQLPMIADTAGRLARLRLSMT